LGDGHTDHQRDLFVLSRAAAVGMAVTYTPSGVATS
jgi:hypothetical protein